MIVEAVYHCPTCRGGYRGYDLVNKIKLTCQWLRRIWTPFENWRSSHGDSLYLSKAMKHTNGGPQATKKDKAHWQYSLLFSYKNYFDTTCWF